MRKFVLIAAVAVVGAVWWQRRQARRRLDAELWAAATDRSE